WRASSGGSSASSARSAGGNRCIRRVMAWRFIGGILMVGGLVRARGEPCGEELGDSCIALMTEAVGDCRAGSEQPEDGGGRAPFECRLAMFDDGEARMRICCARAAKGADLEAPGAGDGGAEGDRIEAKFPRDPAEQEDKHAAAEG